MGKVLRISQKSEELIKQIAEIISDVYIKENKDIWSEYLLPSESQVIEASLETTLKYITGQIDMKGE